MEDPKPTHRPWVGVLLSLLISGTGQFLAGRKRADVLWYLALLFLGLVPVLLAVSPSVPSFWPALLVETLVLVAWLAMLRDAWRPVPRLSPADWFAAIVLACALWWGRQATLAMFARTFTVPTSSMEPTIRGGRGHDLARMKGGDHVAVQCFAYWFRPPQRGDVVVHRMAGIAGFPPDEMLVRRVVGLPGETISLSTGQLHINGRRVTEPPVFQEIRYDDPPGIELAVLSARHGSLVIPPGQYFMLGDNAINSRDCRDYGPVPAANLVGRLTKIYWPPSRAGIPRYVPPQANRQ